MMHKITNLNYINPDNNYKQYNNLSDDAMR